MKIICFVLLMCASTFVFAQKTDDAKKNLDGDKKKKSSQSSESHSSSSSIKEDIALAILRPFIEFTVVGVTHLAFNAPFGSEWQAQSIRYARYPYQAGNHIGVRTTQGDDLRLQMAIAYGQNLNDNFSDLGLNGSLHYRGWALRGRFKYVNEEPSRYTVDYYSASIERKSKAFDFMDMGISAGYGLLHIGGDNYDGFLLGFNLELFAFKPVSLFFKPDVLLYKDQTISTTTFGGNFHFTNYYIGLSYEKFKIAGVPFNNFRALLGLYI